MLRCVSGSRREERILDGSLSRHCRGMKSATELRGAKSKITDEKLKKWLPYAGLIPHEALEEALVRETGGDGAKNGRVSNLRRTESGQQARRPVRLLKL